MQTTHLARAPSDEQSDSATADNHDREWPLGPVLFTCPLLVKGPNGRWFGPALSSASHTVFDAYIETCVPGGRASVGKRGVPFYAKGIARGRYYSVHRPVKDAVDRWHRLDEIALVRMLEGKCRLTVEPHLFDWIDWIEFDLDRKGGESREVLRDRIKSICARMGWSFEALPGVLYRSSDGDHRRWQPGGWRWRVYLDGPQPRYLVMHLLMHLLDDRLVGGIIEAWPLTKMSMPLGAGSHVIGIDGEPLPGTVEKRPRRGWEPLDEDDDPQLGEVWERVDLAAQVRAFVVAKASPVSFADLLALMPPAAEPNIKGANIGEGYSLGRGPSTAGASTVLDGPSTRGERARCGSSRVTDRRRRGRGMWTPAPITEDGQRNEVFRRWTFALWNRGLSWEDAEPVITAWLTREDHEVGKLALGHGLRALTIKNMLASARADFRHMDTKVSRGEVTRGSSHRKGPRVAAAPREFSSPLLDPRKFQPAEVAATLTERDRERLAAGASDDPTMTAFVVADDGAVTTRAKTRGRPPTPRLDRVVGALRLMIAEHDGTEPLSRVAINYDVLEASCGALTTHTLRELQRLGFLGRKVEEGRRGATAAVYELPPDLNGPVRARRRKVWSSWEELWKTLGRPGIKTLFGPPTTAEQEVMDRMYFAVTWSADEGAAGPRGEVVP